MAKVSKLILTYPHTLVGSLKSVGPHYKVVRAQHTTEFNPGDFLTKAQVDELNASNRWDVSVTSAERSNA